MSSPRARARPPAFPAARLIPRVVSRSHNLGGKPLMTKAERKEQKQIFTRRQHEYMKLGLKANKFHYNGVGDDGQARKV